MGQYNGLQERCVSYPIVQPRDSKCVQGSEGMVLADMRVTVEGPTVLLGDCKAIRDIIVKPGSTQRTKYFERATLLVKQFFKNVIVPASVDPFRRHGR